MAFLQCVFRSTVLELNTSINIILPEDIKKNEQLKVLYLLHGYSGDHTDWMRMTSIERYVKDYRVVVVMPDVQNSYYNDMKNGMRYYTYITKEVFQRIKSTFPVSSKREDTFICGLSMGGFGALKIAFDRPNMFAKAASLSGALDIEEIRKMSIDNDKNKQFDAVFGQDNTVGTINDLRFLVKQMKKDKIPKLYLACGTEDYLYTQNLSFVQFLKKENIEILVKESKGDHTWEYWDEHIQKVVKWMLT